MRFVRVIAGATMDPQPQGVPRPKRIIRRKIQQAQPQVEPAPPSKRKIVEKKQSNSSTTKPKRIVRKKAPSAPSRNQYEHLTTKDLHRLVKDALEDLERHNQKHFNVQQVHALEQQLQELREELLRRTPNVSAANLKIGLYPEVEDPEFPSKIIRKKEFGSFVYDETSAKGNDYDAAVAQRCSSDARFELTRNQRFLKNFMSPSTTYNTLLLFHSVGVGKTCTAISIAEQFKHIYQKRILVLSPTNLKDNFRRQIFDINKVDRNNMDQQNQCVGLTYLQQVTDRNIISNDALKKRISQIINDHYQFYGFQEFANTIIRLEENMKRLDSRPAVVEAKVNSIIRETYSDRVIIIDEAHNMRAENEDTSKKVPPIIMRVLRNAVNVKCILLTATPMYNDSKEIVWLLNLVLANEKKPPITESQIFDANGALHTQGRKQLAKITRGYVSFMRGQNPFSFPMRLYPTINNDPNVLKPKDYPRKDIYGQDIPDSSILSNIVLIRSTMKDYQSNVYKDVERAALIYDDASTQPQDESANAGDFTNTADNDRITKSLARPVQISNVVFPSLQTLNSAASPTVYGKEGFFSCFDKQSSKLLRVSYKPAIKKLFGEFLSPATTLGEYSAKLKNVVDYIMKAEGVVFVYSYYLYGGILPLAIALEHAGFSKRNGNILATTNSTKQQPYSYTILTGDTSITPDIASEIDIIRSKENVDGSQVKVIMGTNVTSEGIDFKCIREVHILEPWHHLNRLEQVIGRAIRTCSHVALPKEKRNTTIYHHASVPNYYEKNDYRESIDLRMYRISSNKQKHILEVEEVLKSNAVDCIMNQHVSYFDPDKLQIQHTIITSQGKTLTNFKLGDHPEFSSFRPVKCSADQPTSIASNTSTFTTDFYHDDLALYVEKISTLYGDYAQTYSFEDINQKLQDAFMNMDRDILMYALDTLVQQKIPIRTRDGQHGYIAYHGKLYTLVPLDEPFSYITTQRRANYKAFKSHRIILSNSSPPISSGPKKTGNATASISERNESGAMTRSRAEDIIAACYKAATDIHRFTFPNEPYSERLFRACVDYTIDRLDERALFDLASALLVIPPSSDSRAQTLAASLQDAKLFVSDFDYFRTPYDTEQVYILDSQAQVYNKCSPTNYSKCSPLDWSRYVKQSDPAKEYVANKTIKSFRAYIDIVKGKPNFKLVGNKDNSNGFVCHQTSTYRVEDVRKDIIAVYAEALTTQASAKPSKMALCNIYELVLRAFKPEALARPLVAIAIKKSTHATPAAAKKKKVDSPKK